jgi:hypothetical protein
VRRQSDGLRTAPAVAGWLTGGLVAVIVVATWWSGWANPAGIAGNYARTAMAAAAVLTAAFILPLFVVPFALRVQRGFAWLLGVVAVLPMLAAYILLVIERRDFALLIYQGLRVPVWDETPRFWDLGLILQSIDCARAGFDVYAVGNGCLADPAIYGPGQLWVQVLPFVSTSSTDFLGVLGLLVSALFIVWIARQSSGRGQIALLAAVLGASWLLLLERGNIDAYLLWVAAAVVIAVRRWNVLGVWALAALAIWLMGTWKFYPFAMGLMLLPVLRLKFGWTVIAGYGIATLGYLAFAWEQFRGGTSAILGAEVLADLAGLGRIGVASRMLGLDAPSIDWTWGDSVVVALTVAAALWGWSTARVVKQVRVHDAMLALAGGSMAIAAVLVAGFGFAYKATFLLLTIPLLSKAPLRSRAAWYASTVMLILVAVALIVVWNLLLATVALLVVAGFAVGAGASVMQRALNSRAR